MTAGPATDGNTVAIAAAGVRSAQVLMGCETLEPMLDFFIGRLGLRLDAIFPADAPATAMLSGHGLGLRLVCGAPRGADTLYLLCDDPAATGSGQTVFTAPNGVVVKLVAADPPMHTPPTQQERVVTRAAQGDEHWGVGRAGLRYRDLLPRRHGGAFIASHIRVLSGGPVPDYVHFHKIRFQCIFCRKGSFKLVYEGQGEPFLFEAGDCVLQPPTIRHRVLESSAGAEVVEIGAPAEHITMADHDMALPSPRLPPDHDFGGQRFVHHVAARAPWRPWRIDGFEVQDTGIGAATDGLAGVRVVRAVGAPASTRQVHDTEFCFYFVLSGSLTVVLDTASHRLAEDDCITIPGGMAYAFQAPSVDLTLLEVTLPAVFETRVLPADNQP